ncbi:phosphoenolpyruvate carboxykinase [Rhodomicrobium lacus]|uniref:phosphoenolpyruvate carboxykinase n=1 Tax=Rhodomicrobium lacus TaxID=2498452 RepID=UPI000F8CFE05|nr:phosphoenolpyruvate carboxykinase [Rhodomicrobium lacus]
MKVPSSNSSSPSNQLAAPDLQRAVLHNGSVAALYEQAIRRGEGQVTATGAFATVTGLHTGRSAADKFIVRNAETEGTVWWDNSKAISTEQFDLLHKDFLAHAAEKNLFVQDLFGGASEDHRVSVRVFAEYAWHALFINHLLINPTPDQLRTFTPKLTIIDLPSFKADPARYGVRSETVIACDFTRGLILIGGTSYAGEIKKSVFSYLNYVLPPEGVLPMHCSVSEGKAGDAAVFFGLSGTGKTTLSTDPLRTLIGDDEHGWSKNGLYNFEGGCYAKVIKLSKENEPGIYHAVSQWAAVLENVVLDKDTREPNYASDALTENTRGAYPISYVPGASLEGIAGQPKNILMLTADAFGVLPPISKLTPGQAVYHFLSGYTAKVAGTEKGVTEPTATFSTCFGAPFMSRHPTVYGDQLRKLIAEHKVNCWLVNTGWTGGKYGVGKRMSLPATRALVNLALSGGFDAIEFVQDPVFGLLVPTEAPGVDSRILNPRETWADKAEYDATAKKLVAMFTENFKKFQPLVEADVAMIAPALKAAE